MDDSHDHSPPKTVCEGLMQSAEDEIAAATLYSQTAELMENCWMREDMEGECPTDLSGHELMERAEGVRKIDEEERTHGLQFVEMLEDMDCGTRSKRLDLRDQMQSL